MRKTLILLVLIMPLIMQAQLNFTTGYQFGFVEFNQTNKILVQYNTTTPNVISPFKEIIYFQGFKGGLRYKLDGLYFHIDMDINKRGVTSKSNDGSGENKYRIAFNHYIYSAGIAFKSNRFSVGGSINYINTKIKSDVFSIGTLKTISKDLFWGNTLFFEYRLIQTDILEVSLRPYWNINYGTLNTASLDNYLLPNDQSVSQDIKSQNINTIGISIILYNGKQYL